jgi:hypothetical protein
MTWRIRVSWLMLVFCVINWPLSAFTYAKDEPVTVLSLSWIALIFTCVNTIWTAEVRRDTGSEQ